MRLLSKNAEGYTKGCRLNFEKYVDKVELAMEQAKLFREQPEQVRNELGTTVGSLIRMMQS